MANIIHKGRVVDTDNQPLVGAHIVTINSTPKRGVITDFDGKFAIEGGLYEAFEIGFIGYKGQIIKLTANMPDRVYVMQEDAFQLNEVVVTPRTQPKKNTGINFGSIFDSIGDFFSNIPAPVPYNNQQLPTGNGTNPIYVQHSQNPETSSWISRNPVQAGGIALGLIALGALALKKNKKGSTTAKKTGAPAKKTTPKAK